MSQLVNPVAKIAEKENNTIKIIENQNTENT